MWWWVLHVVVVIRDSIFHKISMFVTNENCDTFSERYLNDDPFICSFNRMHVNRHISMCACKNSCVWVKMCMYSICTHVQCVISGFIVVVSYCFLCIKKFKFWLCLWASCSAMWVFFASIFMSNLFLLISVTVRLSADTAFAASQMFCHCRDFPVTPVLTLWKITFWLCLSVFNRLLISLLTYMAQHLPICNVYLC